MSKLKVDGYCSRKVEYSGEEIYILKKSGSDEKADLDFLRLVSEKLEDGSSEEFYRSLLIGGEEVAGKAEIKANSVKGALGYFVIAVLPGEISDEEKEAVSGVLDNIFYEEENCRVVALDDGRFAVICAYKSEEEKKNLTELAETTEDTLTEQAMIAAKTGVGESQESIATVKVSFDQAVIAAEMGKTQFDKLGMLRLFSKVPQRDADKFVADVLGTEFAQEKGNEELLETISVFLDCNMNISEASKKLFIHRNTLMYRIKKFKELTGLDATKFDDGVCIRAVCLALKLQKKD